MKAMRLLPLVAAFGAFALTLSAQQNVGINTTTPHASAALDVVATDKGVLVPRLTLAQRNAVAAPATGLLIFQTDNTPGFYWYDGAVWSPIANGGSHWFGVNDISNTNPGNVGIGTSAPAPSAQLEINSTTKGVLIPRMTEMQRNTIATPVLGLLIFQTDGIAGFYYFDGSLWTPVSAGGGGSYVAGAGIDITGNTISNTGDTDASNDLTNASTAGGDLSGTFSNLQINTGAVGTAELAGDAVISQKIADGTVENADLAANAVNSAKIADGTVANADLAANAVTSDKILNATIVAADLADGAATSAKIADGTVANIDLANNAVTSDKIQNGTIVAADLAAGVIPTTLPPSGAAGGDLAATYPNPTVARLRGRNVSTTAPTSGQVLKYDLTAAEWAPAADGITFPYAGVATVNKPNTMFSLTNNGTGTLANLLANGNTDTLPALRVAYNAGDRVAILGKNTGNGYGVGVAGLGYGAASTPPLGDDIGVYGESTEYGVRGWGDAKGVAGSTNTGVGGYFEALQAGGKALHLKTPASETALYVEGGNVGIHNSNPWAPLHFANTLANRKAILYGSADNDHQFYGFGVNNLVLRYQAPNTSAAHVFYAGTGTDASTELARISGNAQHTMRGQLALDNGDDVNSGRTLYFGGYDAGTSIGSNRGNVAHDNLNGLDFHTFNLKRMSIKSDGKIRVGDSTLTTPGAYRLYVEGGILTEKVRVAVKNSAQWADYVFAPDYHLRPLSEVEKFVQENKHLPGVPSADEVVRDGVGLAEMDAKLLEKIEELTLYLIDLKKEVEQLKAENRELKTQLKH